MKTRKIHRRTDAAEMLKVSSTRTPAERLALLDARLGEGNGAVKERARIQKDLTKSK